MIKVKVNKKKIKVISNLTKIYPKLEDLSITPSAEQQTFNHPNSYGYDEVVVEAIETETLTITPTEETQNFVGLYNEVNVDKVNTEEKTTELDFSNTDVIEITPNENRYLKKVTINKDEDLVSENIKSGANIFGVEGSFEGGGGSTPEGEYSSLYQDASPDASYSITSSDMYPYFATNITEIGDYYTGRQGARNLFSNMYNLRKIGRLDTSWGLTDCSGMFRGCNSLEYINLEDIQTENVTNMSNMFSNCNELTSVDVSGIDASKCTNVSSIFANCRKLITINYMTNVGKGFTQKTNNYGNYAQTFNTSPLTHDCIVDIANKLYDLNLTYNVAGGGTLYTQRIYLGADNIAKLSSDELAIFTSKGYNVS